MRPLRRPLEEARQRWTRLARTVAAKNDIAELVAAGKDPESKDFASAWTDTLWADAVASAQDGLCAWCTVSPVKGRHVGVIDHLRPRSEVTRDVAETGMEVGPRNRVEDRPLRPEPPLRPGYHWRAYDPDNLAYSCERCNTGWKRTLWPVRPWHDVAAFRAPDPTIVEDELILDPFERDFDPFRHFCFGPLGAIIPREGDERADATISTFALDVQSLCDERAGEQTRLDTDVRSIRRALRDAVLDGDQEPMLRRIAACCAWSSPHAAFYRIALKHTLEDLGLSWTRLRSVWDQRNLATDIPEPPDEAWID